MKQHTSHFWQRYALKKTPHTHTCAYDGCTSDGTYRAPKHGCPQNIKDDTCWHWLCLTHVREYNAAWNFYKDMTEAEIIAHWKRDITWDRPSWPLGNWQSAAAAKPILRSASYYQNHYQQNNQYNHFNDNHDEHDTFKDPFGLFDEMPHAHDAPSPPPKRTTTAEDEAIRLFNLPPHFKPADLQKVYRALVKQHHPDVNGGSLEAEAYIKKINSAYQLLKRYGSYAK